MKTLNLKGLWLGLLGLVLVQATAFAADPGSPAVVDTFIQIFLNMITGKIGLLFIVIILLMSAFTAWRSGNLTHLFWGLLAAIIIGGAPKIAEALLDYGNNTVTWS
ncbi:MAG: Unknown protein [uncultured Campylobacterales bacterium]|uniref:TrbC/VirB2 family protein n=1 Tax=uncultured Campylobacterales bacterium TaxID=352960 RepID=A0A6S6SN06_9BACT|nr:MAG: Unknown protein [uncultured Campylobacterales bacterium]